jgi:HAD superfamily hydrolase (TIGR01509 family)
LVIFDCNGVLVDSEPIAAAVAAEELTRAGIPVTPEIVARYFFGRRPADIFKIIEKATHRRLPEDFAAGVAKATLRRLHAELRAMPHAAYALSWVGGPKCVASSSPLHRIITSLDLTELSRFFGLNIFSASDVPHGKPAPDLFLLAALRMGVLPGDCIVVEDSPTGVSAASAAGMRAIGFVGGSHMSADCADQLTAAGACTIIADLRQLKGAIVTLRGW